MSFHDKYIMFLKDFHEISHHDLFLVQSDLDTVSNSLTKQYDLLHLLVTDDYDNEIQHIVLTLWRLVREQMPKTTQLWKRL